MKRKRRILTWEQVCYIRSQLGKLSQSQLAKELGVSKGAISHVSLGLTWKKQPLSLEERFLEKIDKIPDGCWLWMAGLDSKGYGQIAGEDGKTIELAHRISWKLFREVLPDDKCVLHKCDIPSCVNPDHLFLGSHQDNMDDMVKKGRHVALRGQSNGSSKLSLAQVKEIRSSRLLQRELAVKYGVSQSLISKILRREIWPEAGYYAAPKKTLQGARR